MKLALLYWTIMHIGPCISVSSNEVVFPYFENFSESFHQTSGMEYSKVACTACNLEMRNNAWLIERHWKNKHKDRLQQGEEISTKIPSAGTKTLGNFFPVHKKGSYAVLS